MSGDVVLDVTYTFAWDYPFELKDRSTSMVLLAGKGSGPFSGPAGATSVAKELVKLASPTERNTGRTSPAYTWVQAHLCGTVVAKT